MRNCCYNRLLIFWNLMEIVINYIIQLHSSELEGLSRISILCCHQVKIKVIFLLAYLQNNDHQ